MMSGFLNWMQKQFSSKVLVLLYHRVTEHSSDIWNLSVSPSNFEQHLILLKKRFRIISEDELIYGVDNGKLPGKSIVLTFDDGYYDNFQYAYPILSKHNAPAIFFLPSYFIKNRERFWWDILEETLLLSEELPARFNFQVVNQTVDIDLKNEKKLNSTISEKHRYWKAYELPPPTKRALLYVELWNLLHKLTHIERQPYLDLIFNWAGLKSSEFKKEAEMCMKKDELKKIIKSPLFSIGGHTSTHSALKYHSRAIQEDEVRKNKQDLEHLNHSKIRSFSYPHGLYNAETIQIVREADYKIAFTVNHTPVLKSSSPFEIGRYHVKNYNSSEFEKQIYKWENM